MNHIAISQPATLHLHTSPLAEDASEGFLDDEEVFSPDGDSRLSKEGQNIIEEIQASATGFEQVEPMLGMSKQHIIEVVGQLFRRFDMERKGRITFKNAHSAILLLTGRGLQDQPALMRFAKIDYMWADRVTLAKLEFQNIAFEALRIATTDSLRGSGVNPDAVLKSGPVEVQHSPVAQRLRCLRVALFTPSAWAASSSSPLHSSHLGGSPGLLGVADFFRQDQDFLPKNKDQAQHWRLRRDAMRTKPPPSLSMSLTGTRLVVEKINRPTVI